MPSLCVTVSLKFGSCAGNGACWTNGHHSKRWQCPLLRCLRDHHMHDGLAVTNEWLNHEEALDVGGYGHPLFFSARRAQRVSHSASHAETLAGVWGLAGGAARRSRDDVCPVLAAIARRHRAAAFLPLHGRSWRNLRGCEVVNAAPILIHLRQPRCE